MTVMVFWIVTRRDLLERYQRFGRLNAYNFRADGDTMFLRNVGISLQVNTAQEDQYVFFFLRSIVVPAVYETLENMTDLNTVM
jgi:hypothetical protein